jgi:uncharacterized metal-binding protein
MVDKCSCETQANVLLSCSGASNCGQIANQIVVRLDQEGLGKFFCTAGIGSHNQSMIEGARPTRIMAVDGCATACSKKVAEHAGLNVSHWICVTSEGVKKIHSFDNIASVDIERVYQHARSLIVG